MRKRLRKNSSGSMILLVGAAAVAGAALYLLSKKSVASPVTTVPVTTDPAAPTDTGLVLQNTMPDGMRFYRVTGNSGFDTVNKAVASGLRVFAVLAPSSLGPGSRVPLIYYSENGSDMSSRRVLLTGASSRDRAPWIALAKQRVLGTSA